MEEELNRTVAHTEDGGDPGPSTGGLVETKLEPLEFSSEISLGLESLPSSSSSSQDLLSSSTSTYTTVTTFITTEDTKTKLYLKPPMSPELMIAIAVRNLDPGKVVGASCSDIVAFLCLHFPYFTDNYLECKVRLDHRQINSVRSNYFSGDGEERVRDGLRLRVREGELSDEGGDQL